MDCEESNVFQVLRVMQALKLNKCKHFQQSGMTRVLIGGVRVEPMPSDVLGGTGKNRI